MADTAPANRASFNIMDNASAMQPSQWDPLLVPKEQIDREIQRLLDVPIPANVMRASSIEHPSAPSAFPSLTPGTRVMVQVLKPGERTVPRRSNSNCIEICIHGGGVIDAGQPMRAELHDVWTIPPMAVYSHYNDSNEPWAWLNYANTPLLEKLGVLFEEEGSGIGSHETAIEPAGDHAVATYNRVHAPDYPIGDSGARLRGYEYLLDIDVVESKSLLWPWKEIAPHMNLKLGDNGRGIWLLYNPATEGRQGTSASYFATYGATPPGGPSFKGERGHRHISASINYHTRGSGKSVVNGKTVEWKGGDLLYSAPGWSEHAHYWSDEGWTVITVQDHPMHIALNSLLWQEDLNGPIYTLGLEPGQKGYVGPREVGGS